MKRTISLLIGIILFVDLLCVSSINCFAHSSKLSVVYDDCDNKPHEDGLDEAWYFISKGSNSYHLSHEEMTIKYYFEETSEDGTYSWIDSVSETEAEEIKKAFANSMKKWNNVFFYDYDANGYVKKRKVINVIEGNEADHNLSIFPADGTSYIASTYTVGSGDLMESEHTHYYEWKMKVYVYYFSSNNLYGEEYINIVRERNGAHELGHILGVFDVDNQCLKNEEGDHHQELLMGYGSPMTERSIDITYKDIAGVAVTRGFHTDNEHKWLNMGQEGNGTYKLICSICNGVKYVDSLIGYTYNSYNACGGDHILSSGNLMAVACYGDKDYYKCKYCRYVASFSSNITQNYSKTSYDDRFHKCVNNVNGLEYTFLRNMFSITATHMYRTMH